MEKFNTLEYLREKIEKPQQEKEEENKESITVGRLNELSEKIKKIKPDNFYDIYSQQFLDNASALFDEFIQAENKLDSNTKIKLYRKIKNENFDSKIKKLASLLNDELKSIQSVVEKINKNIVKDEDKERIEDFLDMPIWQRLDKIGKIISVLEKTGLDAKDLRNKIGELAKIIEKQEFRTREGELGKYDN